MMGLYKKKDQPARKCCIQDTKERTKMKEHSRQLKGGVFNRKKITLKERRGEVEEEEELTTTTSYTQKYLCYLGVGEDESVEAVMLVRG